MNQNHVMKYTLTGLEIRYLLMAADLLVEDEERNPNADANSIKRRQAFFEKISEITGRLKSDSMVVLEKSKT